MAAVVLSRIRVARSAIGVPNGRAVLPHRHGLCVGLGFLNAAVAAKANSALNSRETCERSAAAACGFSGGASGRLEVWSSMFGRTR
jgi:hypothetical protein